MIRRLIEKHAKDLELPPEICPEAVLWAVYHCERYTKTNKVPRFEAAYAPGGVSYESSSSVRQEFEKWGSWAACSYSNFQILYITAVELGYEGPPLALDRDSIALPYVVKYINKRVAGIDVLTPLMIADAYNSGTSRDSKRPLKYMRKFRRAYEQALKEYSQCSESTNREEDSSTGA